MLPPTGTKLGLILKTNNSLGNMTEITQVVENSPLMNLIPKDACIVSPKADVTGSVQPRSIRTRLRHRSSVRLSLFPLLLLLRRQGNIFCDEWGLVVIILLFELNVYSKL